MKLSKKKEEKVVEVVEVKEMSKEKKDLLRLMETYKEQNPVKYAQKEASFIARLESME